MRPLARTQYDNLAAMLDGMQGIWLTMVSSTFAERVTMRPSPEMIKPLLHLSFLGSCGEYRRKISSSQTLERVACSTTWASRAAPIALLALHMSFDHASKVMRGV